MYKKPDWFLERFPLSKVPALEIDGEFVYESLVTADYLEEAFPNPPLYPKNPWKKAVDKSLIETWSKVGII